MCQLHYNVLMQSYVARVYGVLQSAAFNRVLVTYRDIASLSMGFAPSKTSDDHAELMWAVLEKTMEIDAAMGKPPLAALFISRVGNRPRAPFFKAYERLYNSTLSPEEWEQLVENIYQQHSVFGIID